MWTCDIFIVYKARILVVDTPLVCKPLDSLCILLAWKSSPELNSTHTTHKMFSAEFVVGLGSGGSGSASDPRAGVGVVCTVSMSDIR
jgi:hypothetical protein